MQQQQKCVVPVLLDMTILTSEITSYNKTNKMH